MSRACWAVAARADTGPQMSVAPLQFLLLAFSGWVNRRQLEMKIRTYCRRSKNDEGKQQFSMKVQHAGCVEFISRMGFAGEGRTDYVDDGGASDDFLTRAGLRQLIMEAQRGDVIVCRDQSRLGRDAIEVTLVVRDLVRDRGCRLFYYVTGQEVQFANAIDQATTFIQGTGHQMELEAIRSRTREALRSRVRDGHIAGGSCYGYRLERKSDGSGRKYTLASVNEAEAPIVRRIYDEFLAGRGLKQIAHGLNNEGSRRRPRVGVAAAHGRRARYARSFSTCDIAASTFTGGSRSFARVARCAA